MWSYRSRFTNDFQRRHLVLEIMRTRIEHEIVISEHLGSDGRWHRHSIQAIAIDTGIILEEEAVKEIYKAASHYLGDTLPNAIENRLLRETLEKEQSRVDDFLFTARELLEKVGTTNL